MQHPEEIVEEGTDVEEAGVPPAFQGMSEVEPLKASGIAEVG